MARGKITMVLGGTLAAALVTGGIVLATHPATGNSSDANTPSLSSVTATTPAAPFDIESYTYSDAFVGGIKVAQIRAIVTGDDRNRWAATIITIGQMAEQSGAEAVKVTLLRNIPKTVPDIMRELGHAWYQPVPNRTVWNDKEKWTIFVAQPRHIADDRTIAVNQAYHEAYRKLIRARVDANKAADQAHQTIAERFHLPSDWKLWTGNVNENTDRVSPEAISIDKTPVTDRLKELKDCLSMGMAYQPKPCT
jgi:hypothetical protein